MSRFNRPLKPSRLTLGALLLSLALLLSYLEQFLPVPVPVPGVKYGLANIVILLCLSLFPLPFCLRITVLKSVLSSFFGGSFASLLYSLCGGLLSLAAMVLVRAVLKGRVSLIGISLAGSVFHNVGQLLAAAILLKTTLVFSYFPVLLLSGLAAGTLTGTIALFSLSLLRQHLPFVLSKEDQSKNV